MISRIFFLILVLSFNPSARASAALDSELSMGKITRVLCQNGEFVKKGQPICEISVGTKMPFIIRAKASGFFQSTIKADEQVAIHTLKAGNFFSISSSLTKETPIPLPHKKLPMPALSDISLLDTAKENLFQGNLPSGEPTKQPSSKREEFLELPKINIPNATPSAETKEVSVDLVSFAPEETSVKNFSLPQTKESASLKLPEAPEDTLNEIKTKKFSLKFIKENISNLFHIRVSSLVALLILFSFGLFFLFFLARRIYYPKITLDNPPEKL